MIFRVAREYQQIIVSQFSKSLVELHHLLHDMNRYTNNNNKNSGNINIDKK
jgi:hypothetical protein